MQPPQQLGVDLVANYGDVERLYYRFFAARVRSWGIDQEEGLQQVMLGLLVRNHGSCPFDARISTLSTYVYLVSSCVLANLRTRENRHRSRFGGFVSGGEDPAEAAIADDSLSPTEMRDALDRLRVHIGPEASALLDAAVDGRLSPRRRAYQELRRSVVAWAVESQQSAA